LVKETPSCPPLIFIHCWAGREEGNQYNKIPWGEVLAQDACLKEERTSKDQSLKMDRSRMAAAFTARLTLSEERLATAARQDQASSQKATISQWNYPRSRAGDAVLNLGQNSLLSA
jgi:hypothetical protein